MIGEKINLLDAQCFFRHLAGIERLNSSARKLSPSELLFYQQITFYHGQVPEDIQKISEDILSQLQKLIVRLIPLYQIGLKYDVYLAGGCIRDLVYGNQNKIKDLDVIFSINVDSILVTLKNTPIFNLESIFGKDIIAYTNWRSASDVKKVHGLFHYCLSKHYSISQGYTIEDIKDKNKEKEYGSILNESLDGIITIKDEEEQYPMDVLLTTSDIDTYIKTFNFELCKAYIPFFKKNGQFITSTIDFLEQIHVTTGFIHDGMKKTITYNLEEQKNLFVIEKSINTHLPRIRAKYPDYKLFLNPGTNEEYIQWKKKYEDYIGLNNELPHKVNIEVGEKQKVLKV